MLKKTALCLAYASFTAAAADTGHYFYRIQERDSITQILEKLNLIPVYGKKGSLRRTLKLNPEKKKIRDNWVFPRDVLFLPVIDPGVFEGHAHVLPDKEVVPGPLVEDKPQTPVPEPTLEVIAETPIPTAPSKGHFFAGLSVVYFRIDSTDKVSRDNSLILSEASPQLDLGWSYQVSRESSIVAQGYLQKYSLKPLDQGQSYADDNELRGGLGLYNHRKFSPRSSWSYGLMVNQEFFLLGKSQTKLAVEKKWIAEPVLGLTYDFMRMGNSAIGGQLSGAYLFPRSSDEYSIESGHRGSIGTYYRWDKNDKTLYDLSLNYGITRQDTSVATKEEQTIDLKFLYHFGN